MTAQIRLAALAVLAMASLAPASAQPVPPASAPPAAITSAPTAVSPAAPEDAPASGIIVRGTQRPIGPSPSTGRYVARPGDVTLNFPATDIHEAAKAILGDILGLNYSVDGAVQGEVTVETAQPVAKEDVLPIFEEALKAANLGLVRRGRVYTIVPLADARRQSQLLAGSDAGYGTEAIVLRFVNVAELRKLIEPLVPESSIAQSDPDRNILMVTGTANERRAIRALVRQFDVNWLRGMSFALFIPQRSNAQTLIGELEQVVNAPGAPTKGLVRLVAIERLNGIVAISAQPQLLADVKRWIRMLDQRNGDNERRLFVYRVQNGRALDLANVIAVAFGGSAQRAAAGAPAAPGTPALGMSSTTTATMGATGASAPPPLIGTQPAAAPATAQTVSLGPAGRQVTITADETNNAIVVYGTAREYAVVEDALRKLDVVPLQVLIEAVVTEVTLNDGLQYGVQWFLTNGDMRTALSNTQSPQPLPMFPGFNYFFNSGNGIRATLTALSSVTDIKVVSSPTLLVLNNHTAAIEVGDQVPIATQSAVSVQNPDAPIVNAIEYRDTGVILRVTPRVNDGGLVLLDISQEVSDVAETASSTINSPTIQQRRIASSVAVQDGRTIALGGLIRDNRTDTKGGIPYLKDIPIFGNLFSNTDRSHKRTELLVLLTPRVVRNEVDLQAVTDEMRNKIRTVDPIPERRRR
jgi:general secretion pathway protein D